MLISKLCQTPGQITIYPHKSPTFPTDTHTINTIFTIFTNSVWHHRSTGITVNTQPTYICINCNYMNRIMWMSEQKWGLLFFCILYFVLHAYIQAFLYLYFHRKCCWTTYMDFYGYILRSSIGLVFWPFLIPGWVGPGLLLICCLVDFASQTWQPWVWGCV